MNMPSSPPAIRITNVHKTLGSGARATHALRGVNLEIPAGAFVALTGKSGSGKTTLLNVISGLLSLDAGTLTIDGADYTNASKPQLSRLRRDTIGLVYQDDLLLPELTALENILLVIASGHVPTAEHEEEARRCLEQVGIEELAPRFPHEMSRGQCQRVGIARAISGDRTILLADEPSAALDSENSHAVFSLFQKLAREGRTVLVSSHDPIILDYCDLAYTLIDGQTFQLASS